MKVHGIQHALFFVPDRRIQFAGLDVKKFLGMLTKAELTKLRNLIDKAIKEYE